MTFIDQWGSQLAGTLVACRDAVKAAGKTVTGLDPKYGVFAAGLLWPVREADVEDDQRDAVREVCGGKDEAKPLLKAIREWPDYVTAARELSEAIRGNVALTIALEKVITHFQDALINAEFVTMDIHDNTVQGGGIVNIGGKQFFYGDVVVNIVQQTVHSCPKAPVPPKHFTGRVDEIKRLMAQLTGPDAGTIMAISGIGGMGKTTLAQALCQSPEFPFKSVLWAEIKENPNVAQTLLTWGRYAKDSFTLPPETPIEQIADLVRAMVTDLVTKECGEPTLVVFDDIWNNEPCYQAVETLRRAMPIKAQVLITTRDEKVIQRLQAKSLTLEELSPVEAQALLQKLITQPKITEAHLERTVALLNGHPLALELAAASLNLAEDSDHIEDILSEYQKGIEQGSPFDAMPLDARTPRSLNVVFARSYNTLSDSLKAQFRAVGVLAVDAPWNRPLLAAVWQIEDEKAVRTIHQELRTRALIAHAEGVDETKYGEGWYQQHRLLHTYARGLLNQAGEHDAAFVRYADEVITLSEGFNNLPPERWNELALIVPHVRAVGDELVKVTSDSTSRTDDLQGESNLRRAQRFALNVRLYISYRREVQHIDWLEMGLSASRAVSDPKSTDLFLNSLGTEWLVLGDPHKALNYCEQALSLSQTMGDQRGESDALTMTGAIWSTLGDPHKALNYCEQALSLSQTIGDPRSKADILTTIGLLWTVLGDQRQARDCYEQALALNQAAANRIGEAATLMSIGVTWTVVGDQHKALDYFEQALPIFRAIGEQVGEANTLTRIGAAWSVLGDQHKALDYYAQALPVLRMVGNRAGEANTLSSIGGAWVVLGDKKQALDCSEQALALYQAVDNRDGEAATLMSIGAAWWFWGEPDKAPDYYERALPIFRAVEDQRGEATALIGIGKVREALGDQRQALNYYEQALALFRAVTDQSGEANALTSIGGVWSVLGDQHKALDSYEQALPVLQTVGDRGGEATTLISTGLTWDALGEKHKALDCYAQAVPVLRVIGDQNREAATLARMGLAWDALGEKTKALDCYTQAVPVLRAMGDRDSEAHTLRHMGEAWNALGDQHKALDCYNQALPVFQAIGDQGGEATTLADIGLAWATSGEARKALEFYTQALPLRRAVGDQVGEMATFVAMGAAWGVLGEKRQALDCYAQALPLSRAVGDRDSEVTILTCTGAAWAALEEKRQALDCYEQMLSVSRSAGNQRGEMTALASIGWAWDALGDKPKALDYYEQALPLRQAAGDRRGEGYNCYNMGVIFEALGELDKAIEYTDRSATLLAQIEDVNAGSVRANLDRLKAKQAGTQ